MRIRTFCQFIVVLFTAVIAITGPSTADVLSVHPKNPRYFTDGSGKAIYLGGHQIFVDLQDNSYNKKFIRNKERTLDWDRYLEFLKAHDFNYLRNWVIWSTGSGAMAPINQAIAFPMPYKRVKGHGKATDGKDKFDLFQFDEVFFRRMLKRCEDLQKCGIYVSIMLFEVYGFLNGEACGDPKQTLWDGNVFKKQNNINGIHVDFDGNENGIEFFYTQDKRIIQLQKEYIKKVIDTVNHLDNVFYEIANELEAAEWQYKMIEFIKDYEKTRPKQHLVLMSAGGRTNSGSWKQMGRGVVVNSPADCFAVAGSWQSGRYRRKDPPVNDSSKPGIVDMDHVAPGSHDVEFIWSAFTRGYHFNLYDKPFESPQVEGPEWKCIRHNIKKTVDYAKKLDLANVSPTTHLASTGFCLAKEGYQYVVYQPEDALFTVSGLRVGTLYYYEWYNTKQSKVVTSGRFKPSGQKETFESPNKGFVLFLTSLPASCNFDVCCTIDKR
jgi:hypothetical protein